MLSHRDPPPFPGQPTDVMYGVCGTCHTQVTVQRSQCQPPQPVGRGQSRENDFGRSELWSVECPNCRHKGMKMTYPDGSVRQETIAPRVFVMKRATNGR